MDPFSNFAIWLGDTIERKTIFYAEMAKLKIEALWIEINLVLIDLKLRAWFKA